MWDTVGIIAAIVVIVLLFQVLDVSETLKARLRGASSSGNAADRLARIEERLAAIEKKLG
jgi:hypothetical protein